MAFQASLLDSGTGEPDITISSSGETLTINDNSNYTTASEGGHDSADFADYRKILVEHPKGEYLFSSVNDGDEDIDAGSSGTNSFNFTTPGVDGVYEVSLWTVPTWNNSDTYESSDDYVYYDGSIYKSIQNGTNQQPDTATAYWEEVDDIEDVSSKYYVTERVARTCGLDDCFFDKTHTSLCDNVDNNCNRIDLDRNKKFQTALIAMMAKDTVPELVDNDDWESVRTILNYTNKICDC